MTRTYLSELHVEVTHASVTMSFDELHGAGDLRSFPSDETIDDGFDRRVTE